MKNYEVTTEQMKYIYEVACSTWKTKIWNMIKPFSETVTITEDQVKEMLAAASEEQKKVIYSVFPKEKDNNAFIREFNNDCMDDISKELFGRNDAIQILWSETPDDKPELEGRAFFVDSKFKVKTGETKCGGTWISVYKKEKWQVGDWFIPTKPEDTDEEPMWASEMDYYEGKTIQVGSIDENGYLHSNNCILNPSWCKKVEK